MVIKIGHIYIFIRDYDEAIKFYTEKLGFELVSNKKLGPGLRWVEVAPREDGETTFVFTQAFESKAEGHSQQAVEGHAIGDRN